MNRLFLAAIFALLLFGSCRSRADRLVEDQPVAPEPERSPAPYTIIDYKNKDIGGTIPQWVDIWLDFGERAVENLDVFRGRYVFVARNEANNFNALSLWKDGFSPELDFPRLAATRIEARLAYAVDDPDQGYGAFFETLIRAASDFPWTGAVRVDDFWTLRRFESGGEGAPEWEFIILVTIDKLLFAYQFETVFQATNPNPPPTRDQRTTINRVMERFFDGF